MVIYASDQFHWDKPSKTLSTDASTLGLTAAAIANGARLDDRIFSDAVDTGFAIRSHKSGMLAVFALHKVDEKDGEIHAWEYRPARKCESMMYFKKDIADFRSYQHTKVVVFND